MLLHEILVKTSGTSDRMEDITRYLAAEQKCVQLIAQFLLYNDFNATLPMFIEEAVTLDYRLSEEELNKVDHIKREDIQKLISAFQSSEHAQFFKAWKEFIPESIKTVPDYKKLTFYLHVHFAIVPFRNKSVTTADEEKEQEFQEKVQDFDEKVIENVNPYKAKVENVVKDFNRLDVIEESSSPSVEYDTDSLDQSQVVIEGDHQESSDTHAEEHDHNEITKTNENTAPNGMDVLKSFLAAEGETYSPQQEFLPFFALPYVPNPDEHPSFTNLFQEKWSNSLNEKFYEFIYRHSCGAEVAPKIAKMCEEPSTGNSSQEPDVKPSIDKTNSNTISSPNTGEIVRRYKQARRRFSKLHRDHQNLIGVAAELTTALENSVRGQAVDLRTTLNNCALIFPELFSNTSTPTDGSSQRLKVMVIEPLRDSKVLCCSELDVNKIKAQLSTGSIKTKLLLLQAIRWRMTRGSGEERDQAVVWLSRHDVLSVHGRLVRDMLQPADTSTPHPLQQSLARLINTVASLRAGRDYLASSHSLLVHLINTVKLESNVRLDNVTSDMLLATLQKLSLRRNARLMMIEKDMVEWLVSRLSGECERLYSLEYSTALLLNLCLHVEARERCPTTVLKLLTDLLDTGQTQIMAMVAGSLYCLLSHDRLNKTARQMNLESVLSSQAERYARDPQALRQIQTLLRLLRGELPSDSILPVSEEPSEDELDDPEILEAELDADDPVKAVGDDQSGEALLENHYRRIFPSHGVVCPYRAEPEIAILPSTPRSRPPTREK
ncbi:lisH domain-containing protein ARMC9-like [Homalodisca vitripennis]|nr:lisH domain-containing protein ARMC9-like [Homalodisca vitripennis]